MTNVYKGETGEIEVVDGALVIRRSGVQARLNFGKDTPDRLIPLQAVRAVLFKQPGKVFSGALRLVLGDEPAPQDIKPQMDDYDMMTFSSQQGETFRALYQWLESVVATNHAHGIDFAAVTYDRGVNAKVQTKDKTARTQDAKTRAKESKFAAQGVREDIATAAGRMNWTLGGKREIKKLAEHVPPDEFVTFIAQGTYANDEGIVVLTDRRMLFVFHGVVRQALEDFPLDRISSVHTKAGMVTGDLTVHASGNQAVITRIVKADLKHLADALRARIHANSAGATPAAAPLPVAAPHVPSEPDVMEQLLKLGQLRDLGVLTDDEFSTKKAELLRRL